MSRVVVIGGGVMGLAAAYRAAKNGHEVEVLEAAPEPGGMAGHFDFDGISIERFYHFVCKTDYPTFALLKELGMEDVLRWRQTTMGLYSGGRLHGWGDPRALLRYPLLGPIAKLRYAVFVFVCVRRDRWAAIENETAKEWIIRWCGRRTYRELWERLLGYKFYEYAENISAAWIWTRIRRIGRSRRDMFHEELGYMEGGSLTLVNALIAGIEAHGGRIRVGHPAKRVTVEGGRVTGVETPAGHFAADHVLSTCPTPLVSAMVPDLDAEWRARYDAIPNIGVICVIFKLRRSVTPHFWVNISEEGVEIPGIIEFSNLRSAGEFHIVYVPYYMPVTNEKFSWTEERLLDESFSCLQRVNGALTREDVVATKVARLRHGQPVCAPGFAATILPVQTPIAGLQIADTCYYYPEDRGIAESVRLGLAIAESLGVAG
jgi:protoporphyrinogen oxidase